MKRHAILGFITSGFLVTACSGDDGGTTAGTATDASTTLTATATATATATDSGTGTATDSTASGTSAGSDSATSGTSGTSGTSSGGTMSSGTSATTTDSAGSSDTGTSNSDTSTSGGSGGIMPCDTAEAVLQPIPPNIMLVLDKSGSMVSNTWDHDNMGGTPEVTRWKSLYDTVEFITNTFDGQINFGAQLFPEANACNQYSLCACDTSNMPEVDVGMNNAAAIQGAIPGPNETNLAGGTPADKGITSALTHLKAQNPANPRAIMFITDGAANCAQNAGTAFDAFENYDTALHTTVDDAFTNDMIPTYVVGIDIENALLGVGQDGSPEANPWERLDDLANEGGTCIGDCASGGQADFYQTTDQTELQDAMQDIINNALSCVVPLNPPPPFPDLMDVKVDGMLVPKVNDCANEDGWVYTNPNGPYDEVELCGTWCDTLKMTGELKAEYFCMPG